MTAKRWVMGIAAIWGLMTGCKPAPVGLGPFPTPAPEHPGGLRYYLAKDFVLVEADVTEFVETRVASDGGKPLKEETETGISSTNASVFLKTTADPAHVFILDITLRGASDQSMAVRVGDNGLLSSVDVESKDRAAEILVQVARVIGEVAGAAAGFRGSSSFDPGGIIRTLAAPGPEKMSTADAGRRKRRLESLSLEALYFLQESAAARELWGEVDRFEDELSERRGALRGHTDEAAAASEPARYSLAEKRAEFLEGSIRFLEKQAEQARTAFEAAVRKFAAVEGFGRTTRERKVRRHLEITDLPPSAVLTGASDEGQIVAALEKKFPRVLDLYQETGIIVVFDPALAVPDGPVQPAAGPGPARKKEVRVYYREPIPGFLRVYSWTDAADRETKQFHRIFARLDEKLVFLIHPGTPVRNVGYDRKAFSSRNIQLVINGQGRVVGISKSAASASAASAAGAASALAAIRDEISETLGEVQNIVETLRKLSLGNLETQVELLKLQLDKLKNESEIEKYRDRTVPEE
ncbi:MAG: hypothetical protein NTW38_05140 [Candidatus Aminicenantes bacterium]|nr:hypothetical protein [Candidatus Aminicenantes bacterium]